MLVEHLVDQAKVAVDHHPAAVGNAHAGRLLAPVLQREQGKGGKWRRILARRMDADDAAHG